MFEGNFRLNNIQLTSHTHGKIMTDLSTQLAQLENQELVRRAPDADWSYLFNHALIQESAYESLLLKQRREIHQRVAAAYERLYPDRLDENADLLAQHYRQAGDDVKTFHYAVRAGDAAARVFANIEADSHYAQALDALARLPETPERQQAQVDTLLKQVSVSLRAVGPADTLRRLVRAETLARRFAESEGATRQDRLRLARVQYWQGHALIHQNQARAALQKMEQVLQVARAENDPALLAIPASLIGRTLVTQGHFARAVPILSDAVRALELVHDEHEWLLAAGFKSLAVTMLGDYREGLAEAERTIAHATEANTLTGMAFAHGILGTVYLFGNALPEGITHARTMIDLATQSGDRLYAYVAYSFIAWADARAGDCRDAAIDFAQAQRIAEELGGQLLFADWFAAARAEYALRCGQIERALSLAGTVSQRAHRRGSLFAEGIAERVRGQALAGLATPRLDGADVHLAQGVAKLEEGGARLEAARARVAWADVLARRGNLSAAREQLERSAAAFRASGLRGEQEQAEHLTRSLSM